MQSFYKKKISSAESAYNPKHIFSAIKSLYFREKKYPKTFCFGLKLRLAMNLLRWDYKAHNPSEKEAGVSFELKSRVPNLRSLKVNKTR